MKNGNRYSFNPRRKIIPQIVAMRTGKFGYTLIVHLASNLIGVHYLRLPDPGRVPPPL